MLSLLLLPLMLLSLFFYEAVISKLNEQLLIAHWYSVLALLFRKIGVPRPGANKVQIYTVVTVSFIVVGSMSSTPLCTTRY